MGDQAPPPGGVPIPGQPVDEYVRSTASVPLHGKYRVSGSPVGILEPLLHTFGGDFSRDLSSQILGPLYRSRRSRVYKAEDISTGKPIACKLYIKSELNILDIHKVHTDAPARLRCVLRAVCSP